MLGVDDPVAVFHCGAGSCTAGAWLTYAKDHLNSVEALISNIYSLFDSYSYTAYGVLRNDFIILNVYTYTSQYYDSITKNYYFRNRFYKPDIGRFITNDPSILNWYEYGLIKSYYNYNYVENRPLIYFDPYGLTKCKFQWLNVLKCVVAITTAIALPLHFPAAACFFLGPEAGFVCLGVIEELIFYTELIVVPTCLIIEIDKYMDCKRTPKCPL